MRNYGIGPLTSITIPAELGDARRFGSSRDAVRYAGLDITVHQSGARRPASPGHDYHTQTAARLGAPRLSGRRAQAAQAQLPHTA